MAIQYKIYNRKYQLHFYNEVWELQTKHQLDEILSLFAPQEMAKVKIIPLDNKIEIHLQAIFLECRTAQELKQRFSLVVDMKDKYQKMELKGEMKKKRFQKKGRGRPRSMPTHQENKEKTEEKAEVKEDKA